MHAEEEPTFEATVSDLGGQQVRRLFTSGPARPAGRWRVLGLLLVAGLLRGGLLVNAWPPAPRHDRTQATPIAPTTAAPTSVVNPAVFAALAARQLRFPRLVPSVFAQRSCPVMPTSSLYLGIPVPAVGDEPLYLVGGDAHGTVPYLPAAQWTDHLGWGGMVEPGWFFPGTFAGPLLVRGQRLDAAGAMQFNALGGPLLPQLRTVMASRPAALYQAVWTWSIRFQAPGCYGVQIDWRHGTEVIVVWARRAA
jgi:hypothetical protein